MEHEAISGMVGGRDHQDEGGQKKSENVLNIQEGFYNSIDVNAASSLSGLWAHQTHVFSKCRPDELSSCNKRAILKRSMTIKVCRRKRGDSTLSFAEVAGSQ